MKHVHSELIKRWADNPRLIVLAQACTEGAWIVSTRQNTPTWLAQNNYFLVCERHVDVALHWLNGGELLLNAGGRWYTTSEPEFDSQCTYKIKPKLEKVKIWVGVTIGGGSIMAFDSNPENNPFMGKYTWTEVEVDKEIV
jgi:hypothetical protein